LIISYRASGFPVLRALSLCACCRHYPGAAAGDIASLGFSSSISLPQTGYQVGLRIVLFEDCSAFTRVTACTLARSPFVTRCIEGFSRFVHLLGCSDYFRLERLPGGACTHWKSAAFARRTPGPAVRALSSEPEDQRFEP
jgi:hypothetical protein